MYRMDNSTDAWKLQNLLNKETNNILKLLLDRIKLLEREVAELKNNKQPLNAVSTTIAKQGETASGNY